MNIQKKDNDTLKPSDQFIKLVKFMDSCNYIWDTSRIKVISPIVPKKYVIIDNKLFYKMAADESEIVNYYNNHKDYKPINPDINESNSNDTDDPKKKGLVDVRIFSNPNAIWGYYYRNRSEKILITDGFVEQWEFRTSNEAINTYNEINKTKSYIFFNTESYCYLNEKNVYVFHCRAMAFSFQLKKFYEYLKNLKN